MVFPDNHPNDLVQNKCKRLKHILTERGVRRNRVLDGHAFFLKC